jgi:uncharacterized membrane protein
MISRGRAYPAFQASSSFSHFRTEGRAMTRRVSISPQHRQFRMAGLILGIGLGGFVDGIVAHQLLGWHHLLSSWYPPHDAHTMRLNMVGDGLFHLFCLVVIAVGVVLLNRSGGSHSTRRLVGWILAGWGVFNLVEGVIDHLLLGVHHVRSGPHQLLYDLGFLMLGAILLACGSALGRGQSSNTAPQ